ncbi:FAD binding domain-containing protein [Streptomyces sp. NBC_00063]|uniref:FAD binding domain-containing protein n=1 Tax=Streptomyces sp. NBC_00063 TaxID=2975638 RepID=UPI003D74AF7C
MRSRHALVIGGSIGGLCAAILLRQAGWRTTIFERSREGLASRGAGLGITRELMDAMHRCGAPLDTSSAVQLSAIVTVDRVGRVIHELPRHSRASVWSRIYLPLRRLMPDIDYCSGMMLNDIEQDSNSITAIFADGSRVRGDLLVGADGNASTVRTLLQPNVAPRYAGYVAWRGVMPERDLPSAFHDEFFDKLTFAFPEGEQFAAMPVPSKGEDLRPGHRGYYFIWYRPANPAMVDDLCTDERGVSHGTSIPPPLIRRRFTREIEDRAEAMLAPRLASVVRQASQLLLQPITDLETPKLVMGRAVLMGDAAFVARPHVAAGATKAALDATCLASELAADDDIDAALTRYEIRQHRFGSDLVAAARRLGAPLEAQGKPMARRGGEGGVDPIQLMRQFGAPHLVHDPDPE